MSCEPQSRADDSALDATHARSRLHRVCSVDNPYRFRSRMHERDDSRSARPTSIISHEPRVRGCAATLGCGVQPLLLAVKQVVGRSAGNPKAQVVHWSVAAAPNQQAARTVFQFTQADARVAEGEGFVVRQVEKREGWTLQVNPCASPAPTTRRPEREHHHEPPSPRPVQRWRAHHPKGAVSQFRESFGFRHARPLTRMGTTVGLHFAILPSTCQQSVGEEVDWTGDDWPNPSCFGNHEIPTVWGLVAKELRPIAGTGWEPVPAGFWAFDASSRGGGRLEADSVFTGHDGQ
jgi:hypothetical protein